MMAGISRLPGFAFALSFVTIGKLQLSCPGSTFKKVRHLLITARKALFLTPLLTLYYWLRGSGYYLSVQLAKLHCLCY